MDKEIINFSNAEVEKHVLPKQKPSVCGEM